MASPAQSMKPRSWAPDCFEWNVPGMVLHSAERWSGDETYVRQLAVAKASQLVKDNPAERSVFAAHSSSRFQMWLITARPSSFADKLIEALMGSAIEVVGVLSSILALSEQDVPVEPLDRLFVSNGCIHSLSIEPGTSKSRTSLESQITNVLTACSAAIGDLPVRLRRAHGLAKSMRRSSLRERSLRVLERWS